MARLTQAASHLSVEAVKAKMETAPNQTQRSSHWRIVYNALVEPRRAQSIALHTGVSPATVSAIISHCNRFGPAALDTDLLPKMRSVQAMRNRSPFLRRRVKARELDAEQPMFPASST